MKCFWALMPAALFATACGQPLTDINFGAKCGTAVAAHSHLTVTPASGTPADGRSTVTAQLEVRDANNIPVTNVPVSFTVTNVASPGFLATATTNIDGIASTLVASDFAGPKQVSAHTQGIVLTGTVTFAAASSTCARSLNTLNPPAIVTALQGTTYLPPLFDLNGDGAVDLAYTNPNTNTVGVALNNGKGRFAAPVNYPTGNTPVHMVVCDLNNDGIMDVVTANITDATVSVLLGRGAGVLAHPVSAPIGTAPITQAGVACGDITGDGNNDVVASNFTQSTIVVLPGTGTGALDSNVTTGVATAPWNVHVNATLGDVSYVDNQGNLFVMANAGSGHLGSPAAYALNGRGAQDFTFLTIDANNKQNIVTANAASNNLSVLLYQGNNTYAFGSNVSLPGTNANVVVSGGPGPGPSAVGFGRFNGDAFFDVVTQSRVTGLVYVALGDGAGNFTAKGYHAGYDPISVRVADFNGDGNNDVAVLHSTNTISILFGDGQGGLIDFPTFTTAQKPTGLATSDVDRDGHADVIVSTGGAAPWVQVYRGSGTGTFTLVDNYPLPAPSFDVAVADFNMDGWPDMVAATQSPASGLQVFINQGNGTFGTPTSETAFLDCMGIGVGDFNADGIPDLATGNHTTNQISILLGQGNGLFQTPVQYTAGSVGAEPSSLVVTDLNADGNQDIVVAMVNDERVAMLLGAGDGTFANPELFTGAVTGLTGTQAVCSADFNMDGYPDVAGGDVGNSNSYINVFAGGQNGGLTAFPGFALSASTATIFTASLARTGVADLVTPDNNSASLLVSSGLGNGTFHGPRAYVTGGAPYGVALADFNGDGAVDAAVGNGIDNTFTVHINVGCP